ncbi:MAG: glycosyl hydrolase family 65 protein [Anaerocolumna aminovalerica]|jgi:nigerose phosphorylase|uniref:glycosyl hydrolase family 65 protein n=1 Tax=Anaerocolumna aminovalerica TaxID=1527 RepID=UPI002913E903|nr:glycosyl hydrolase family 65 protein [Anaerocolumna aminovalerica]MDU6264464.1 glycosyl hydrolase family 65 protein [Anaerocolumna aminovalerica]
MINWSIEENGFNKERATGLGNKFLTGNGYMGIRGTLEEYKKEQLPAINLSGIYDQAGEGWREPLNAPNGLFTRLVVEGEEYILPEKECVSHNMSLDYRHGIFRRLTRFCTAKGDIVLETERFASMKEKHLICLKVKVTPFFEGDFEIITGIDSDVWDINGPHYEQLDSFQIQDSIFASGITHECREEVFVGETIDSTFPFQERIEYSQKNVIRHLSVKGKPGKEYCLHKYISVYTSKDMKNYREKAIRLLSAAKEKGFQKLIEEHMKIWEEKWKVSEVFIEGDDEAMEALNYSLYHLHSIAPRHTKSLSIAARGLSGQTYKGAVFWDTEMFMLDFFLFTEPEVAKTLLRYRIDTLSGAKKKAKHYGYEGAFYAWESQEGGFDACSDYNVTDVFTGRPMRTYFKDKQIHISAAVAYGIMRYVEYTGKDDLLKEGGGEVIIECARFYYSLLVKRVNKENYELWDVIGPDEYHERVNNNAYTNRMAKFTFDAAIKILEMEEEFEAEASKIEPDQKRREKKVLLDNFRDGVKHLYIPQPNDENGVIEQFDGYEQLEEATVSEIKSRLLHEKEYWGGAYGVASHTKIIKQADVITMLNLFSNEYDKEILYKNWAYYEPRTEHGSSLSACMYSMVACKCSMADKAYPLFLKSARADLEEGGKQWAGLVYIGGTHPAAAGGAYMTAVEGFGGIYIENGVLKAKPDLPSHWTKLRFQIFYMGELYQVTITKKEVHIEKINRESNEKSDT